MVYPRIKFPSLSLPRHKKMKDTTPGGKKHRKIGELEKGKAKNFIASCAGRQLLLLLLATCNTLSHTNKEN